MGVAMDAPQADTIASFEWRRYLTPVNSYYFVLVLLAAISIWIRTGVPVLAVSNGSYDDQLFVRLAIFLGEGRWLGPYDQLTLAKGMFYPLFIILVHFLSIPLKIAEQAIYLAASALVAELMRRRVGGVSLGVATFALLAFDPVFWTLQMARVIREGLYVTLSLLVFVLVIEIAFPSPNRGRRALLYDVLKGFSLGLAGAAYWLTREEGVWLLPALAVVIALAIIRVLRPDRSLKSDGGVAPSILAQFNVIALPFALAAAVSIGIVFLVAELNYLHYGVFADNEFRAKPFLRAYGALTRIRHDEWRPNILFPKDARQRAYAVSPAARELASSFEGNLAKNWQEAGCSSGMNVNPCSEVLSGWFQWEFRGAVEDAGHYRSGTEAMNFYNSLADQIDAACALRTIECLPQRATMLPPFWTGYLGGTLKASKAVAKVMFVMGEGQVGSLPSTGPIRGIAIFAETVGDVYPPKPERDTRVIQGWTAALSGTPTVRIHTSPSERVSALGTMLPAPDILAEYPNFKPTRFKFVTDCPLADCELVVDGPDKTRAWIPLTKLASGMRLNAPSMLLKIESISILDPSQSASALWKHQLELAAPIALGYSTAFPVLATLGIVGLLLASLFRRHFAIPMDLLALGLGSAVAVGSRIALLAFIGTTMFPAAATSYASPASPFVIIFTIAGIYSGCAIFLDGNHGLFRRYAPRGWKPFVRII